MCRHVYNSPIFAFTNRSIPAALIATPALALVNDLMIPVAAVT
jgi:hypothetical protein